MHQLLLASVIYMDLQPDADANIVNDYFSFACGGELMALIELTEHYATQKKEEHKANNAQWESYNIAA